MDTFTESIRKVVRRLSDDALVTNLNRLASGLDEWVAAGIKNPDREPELQREAVLLSALREEWRARSGEII